MMSIVKESKDIWTIQKLKNWAIDKFNRTTMNRVRRCYYGPKEVVEDIIDTQMDYWIGFWDLWKEKKQDIKECGFGIFKDYDTWIIFCETKFIPNFEITVKEYEEKRLKPSKILLSFQKNKITKNDAIFQLETFIEEGDIKKQEELLEALKLLIEISPLNEDLYTFLKEIAISFEYYQVRMNSMVYLAKLYPKESKSIMDHLLKTDSTIAYFLMFYYSREERQLIGNLLEESYVKRVLTRELAESTWKNYLRKYYNSIH